MSRHLTYANVMSTLGVFLALAGGFAIAKISGDGSVRSGQLTDLDGDFATVVSVPKLGKVTAACVGGLTKVAWNNTIPTNERVSVDFIDTATQFLSDPGQSSAYTMSLPESKLVFHVFRNNGDDTPQTVVNVAASGFSDPCADSVAAEAVSTR